MRKVLKRFPTDHLQLGPLPEGWVWSMATPRYDERDRNRDAVFCLLDAGSNATRPTKRVVLHFPRARSSCTV
jgi:hypothetical protein